jgi:hypothetical protein
MAALHHNLFGQGISVAKPATWVNVIPVDKEWACYI